MKISVIKNFKLLNSSNISIYHGEGNGSPLQYSCVENPWTEEPGRLLSMKLQKSDMT